MLYIDSEIQCMSVVNNMRKWPVVSDKGISSVQYMSLSISVHLTSASLLIEAGKVIVQEHNLD